MRRIFSVVVVVCALLLPASASAQFDLSRLFGGGKQQGSATTTTQSSHDPYQRLAATAPAASVLNGTWSYQSASFSYIGSNPLADVVIAQLNPVIGDALSRLGITRGTATLSLQSGRGTITHGDYVMSGGYTYTRSTAAIVATTTLDSMQLSASGYVRYSSGELTVLLDARELAKAMKSVMPELAYDQNFVLVETLLRDIDGDVYVAAKFRALR